MKRCTLVLAVSLVLVFAGAGRADEIFAVGSAIGTAQEVSNSQFQLDVVITTPSDGSSVGLRLDKTWLPLQLPGLAPLNSSGSPVGDPAGPSMVSLITLPSAAAAGQSSFVIHLDGERLRNSTAITWTDFHVEIRLVSGDGALEVLGELDPGTRLPTAQYLLDGDTHKFDFYGGTWAHDGVLDTLFTSAADPLRLNVQLGSGLTMIQIKEWPTVPEPATVGLLALGSVALAALRRRRP